MTAHAPYNFVPLPKDIVRADEPPSHDRYHAGRYSGHFDVTLTTQTPLYIRGMLTAEEEKVNEELRKRGKDPKYTTSDFFGVDGVPRLPGSSLRGMLRAMLEIITFSKIQPTSQQPIFFRAVAAMGDDPLKDAYEKRFGRLDPNIHAGRHVRAGYLRRKKSTGEWVIEPAPNFYGNAAFGLVSDEHKKSGYVPVQGVRGLKRFNDRDYTVQVHPVCYKANKGRVTQVWSPGPDEEPTAMLVCTGNMLETDQGNTKSPRNSYALVKLPDKKNSQKRVRIPESVRRDYRDGALTPFLQEAPFDKLNGALQPNRPVFYLEENDVVTGFGHTPNFRVAHLTQDAEGEPRAITPTDRVPPELRDPAKVPYDMAETLFGFVRERDDDPRPSSYAGRVSVTSGALISEFEYESEMTPQILSSPKPTTFQHYLDQGPSWENTPKPNLRHYGNPQARIRGHKLYWRQNLKSSADAAADPQEVAQHETQYTRIRPLKRGTQFRFRVYFDNLSKAELGALAWTLSLGGDADAYHMLGMAKPYGFGAVKLAPELYLCERPARYARLFNQAGTDWHTGYDGPSPLDDFITAFKATMPKGFDDHPRIAELKTMLRLYEPHKDFTYMTIEPNEFKDRPVLPLPRSIRKLKEG